MKFFNVKLYLNVLTFSKIGNKKPLKALSRGSKVLLGERKLKECKKLG